MGNSKTKCIDCEELKLCEQYKPTAYFLPYTLNICPECILKRIESENKIRASKNAHNDDEPPMEF